MIHNPEVGGSSPPHATLKKGFIDWLQSANPDVICIQETKAHIENLDDQIINPSGYHSVWHSAEKKGYSGVAIFTKIKPKNAKIPNSENIAKNVLYA